jgi:hypothetical protein
MVCRVPGEQRSASPWRGVGAGAGCEEGLGDILRSVHGVTKLGFQLVATVLVEHLAPGDLGSAKDQAQPDHRPGKQLAQQPDPQLTLFAPVRPGCDLTARRSLACFFPSFKAGPLAGRSPLQHQTSLPFRQPHRFSFASTNSRGSPRRFRLRVDLSLGRHTPAPN